MFGIGANELIIILLFGFLVFGPDKLPAMAKTIGRAIAKFRMAQQEMNNVIKNEVYDPTADDPFKNPLDALSKVEERVTREDRGESFSERKARYDKQRAAKKAAEERRVTREGAKSTDKQVLGTGAGVAAKEKHELKGIAESKAALDCARAAQEESAAAAGQKSDTASDTVHPGDVGDASTTTAATAATSVDTSRPTPDELYGVAKRARKPGMVSVKRVPAAKKVAPISAKELDKQPEEAADSIATSEEAGDSTQSGRED